MHAHIPRGAKWYLAEIFEALSVDEPLGHGTEIGPDTMAADIRKGLNDFQRLVR